MQDPNQKQANVPISNPPQQSTEEFLAWFNGEFDKIFETLDKLEKKMMRLQMKDMLHKFEKLEMELVEDNNKNLMK